MASERLGVFGVSAPPRSPEAPPTFVPVPAPSRTDVEPAPAHPEPQPRLRKKSLFQRIANNLALRIFLATGAIAGTGYAAYQKVPAIHRTIDQQAHQALARFGLIEAEAVVPPIFDNKAISGVITPNMIEKVPQEEIDRLTSIPFGEIHPVIQILYPIDIGTSENPNTQVKYRRLSNTGVEQEGSYNVFEFDNVPPGTIIRAPIDGILMVDTDSGTLPVNDHDYNGGTIVFKTADGRTFALAISGGTKINRGGVLKSLTNAPALGWRMTGEEGKDVRNKRIPVKRGDPILQVVGSENIMMGVFVTSQDFPDISKGKKIILPNGKEAILLPNVAPTNLVFFSTPEGKLITPQE